MKKQTVYIPIEKDLKPSLEVTSIETFEIYDFVKLQEGYFFTSEQLNKYTKDVIREALETAVKKVKNEIACDSYSTKHYNHSVKPSIRNTFEETFKKFKI